MRSAGPARVRGADQWVAFVHNPTESDTTTWLSAPSLAGNRPVLDLLTEEAAGSIGPARPLPVRLSARDTRVLLIGDVAAPVGA